MNSITEQWKKFKDRQTKRWESNNKSKEYFDLRNKLMKEEEEKKKKRDAEPWWKFFCLSSGPDFTNLLFGSPYQHILYKGMYPETVEGMLNWINDGKPE